MDIEGKTIDEAIQKACEQFQVPREKLNIELISEGTAGFLGLGAKKAQIRASLLNVELSLDAPFGGPLTEVLRETTPPRRPAAEPVPGTVEGKAAIGPASPPPSPRAMPPEQGPAAPTAATSAGLADESSAEKARSLLAGILERMQLPSGVTVEETAEAIVLNIQGDGSGLLIGKRGQNLDALQYIVNKAVHHASNGHKTIVVDTEEYRKRREEALVALAQRMGDKVKKTRKQVTIGHMNARDRRLIHMAIQDDADLTTKSRGEGEYRKIVILPAQDEPDPAP